MITLTGEGEAQAVVHVLEDGVITMEAARAGTFASDQTYQVWAITDEGPSSLGLLGPAPDGEALGAMRVDLAEVESVAVTVEPAGGSATADDEPRARSRRLRRSPRAPLGLAAPCIATKLL